MARLGDEDGVLEVDGVNGHAGPSKKNVDDLLPVGVSGLGSSTAVEAIVKKTQLTGPFQRLPAPPPPRRAFKAAARKEWAHIVDVRQELVNVR